MWRIDPAGDSALLVTVGDAIEPELLGTVLELERRLQQDKPTGMLSTVTAYASLLIRYDPLQTSPQRLEESLRTLEPNVSGGAPQGNRVDVPTTYNGPDLQRVADYAGIDVQQVIDLHASVEYLVYCIGFAPGFAYCGSVPKVIACPRLPSPRTRVDAGSVGIAGQQTGIYPVDSPGGWNIIGRTALGLFDLRRDPPALLKPGDRVRFIPE
jgi:KipI family sensor histidine kinase inhibitor